MKKCISGIVLMLALIMCMALCVNAADSSSDIIKAGEYPQTKVTDSKIISALEKLPAKWKKMDECTEYSDVVYNGKRYRALKLLEDRPNTYLTQYYNGYNNTINDVYWFKYEPIEWIILDSEKGLCITKYIIDTQPFEPSPVQAEYSDWENSYIYRNKEDQYANYFPYSFINSWLQGLNADMGIGNFVRSWSYEYIRYDGMGSAQGNTYSAQLLSVQNAMNFLSGYEFYPGSGMAAEGTDYAKALGLRTENGKGGWWLSDGGYYSNCACCVLENGTISDVTYVTSGVRGVRPTVAFDFDEVHTHKYVGKVTKKATEKAQGEKKYECSGCGEYYTEILPKTENKTLSKVKGLKVKSRGTEHIKISWSKVSGAEKYTVYYSTNGKKWSKKTAKSNSITVKKLKAGTKYQFKIVAVSGSKKGKASEILTTCTKPSKVVISSLKSAKTKALTVTWKTVSGASGYQVKYSTSKKFTEKTTKSAIVKKQKSKKTTIKKLKKGKRYYVKVRAYKTADGKKIYGAYSAVKNIKVK